MKFRRFALIFSVVAMLAVSNVFAEEGSLSSAWNALMNDGKQVWQELKGTVAETGNQIGEGIKNAAVSMYAGDWAFVNGSCSTVMTLAENGVMTVTQKSSKSTVIWSGTFEMGVNKITFKVTKKEEKAFFSKTSNMNETWTLSFKVFDKNEARVTSENLPKDGNGFDFNLPAVFVKQ